MHLGSRVEHELDVVAPAQQSAHHLASDPTPLVSGQHRHSADVGALVNHLPVRKSGRVATELGMRRCQISSG